MFVTLEVSSPFQRRPSGGGDECGAFHAVWLWFGLQTGWGSYQSWMIRRMVKAVNEMEDRGRVTVHRHPDDEEPGPDEEGG